jgi:hypothetical protein
MKEFSPFSSSYHVLNNLNYLNLVFFFAVLAIEDAVLFVAKSDTAEEMR